jgi:hypothetical protein
MNLTAKILTFNFTLLTGIVFFNWVNLINYSSFYAILAAVFLFISNLYICILTISEFASTKNKKNQLITIINSKKSVLHLVTFCFIFLHAYLVYEKGFGIFVNFSFVSSFQLLIMALLTVIILLTYIGSLNFFVKNRIKDKGVFQIFSGTIYYTFLLTLLGIYNGFFYGLDLQKASYLLIFFTFLYCFYIEFIPEKK